MRYALLYLLTFLSVAHIRGQSENPTEQLLSLNGTRIFLKTIGEGEPVIVLHGGPLLDHSYLYPHLQPLAREYQLIFFDQRLSGRSTADVDTSAVNMSMFVEDIEALRKHYGFENFHLFGHSWGGLIAMEYAAAYPDRLHSLMLVSSLPLNAELWTKEQVMAKPPSKADSLKRAEIMHSGILEDDPARGVKELLLLSFKREFYDTAFIHRLNFFIPPDYMQRSRLFGNLMPYLKAYDLKDDLKDLEAPVLIVYGSEEAGLEISGAAMRSAFSEARMITVPQSGHFPFIERPTYFLHALKEFLSKSKSGRYE